MEPFMAAAGLTVPTTTLPVWFVNIIANVVELYYGFMFYFLHQSLCGRITRYSVTTTGQDFYTNTDKAEVDFGYQQLVSREDAHTVTCQWVKEFMLQEATERSYFGGRGGSSEALTPQMWTLYFVHSLYGTFLAAIGVALFVFPDATSAAAGIPLQADEKWGRVIVNTSGIIVFVLGLYSLVVRFSCV
jgi:hypothetical protein